LATGVVRLVGTDVEEIERTAAHVAQQPADGLRRIGARRRKGAERIAAIVAQALG
jgi:hypothetical protein